MLTDIDKEFETPLEDENGELIEVIELEEAFTEEDIGLEEKDDSFYQGVENDLADEINEDLILEENVNENVEIFNNSKNTLIELYTKILEAGEITAEDNILIEEAKESFVTSYTTLKENVNKKTAKTLEERLDELKENFVGASADEILNILTENGTKCWLYKDDDDNVLIDGTSIPELTVLVNKFNMIATDGENEGELKLTPEFMQTIMSGVGENLEGVTDAEMQSAIIQSKDQILSTVSQAYQSKDDMKDYSTTTQMNSAINQSATNITNTVSSTYYNKNDVDGKITNINQRVSIVDQKADKISWLVKSGTSESNMVLTDKLYSLMTSKVLIEAKKIELNGSININNGAYKVSTNGNTKIGGNSAVTTDGYLRAICEITSNGTIYSCSSTEGDVYTKITEGKITLNGYDDAVYVPITIGNGKMQLGNTKITEDTISSSSGGIEIVGNLYTNRIQADGIKSVGELVLACNNQNINYTGDSAGRIRFRNSSGNYYFDPHASNAVRLGSTSYLWNVVYATNGVKTSSDRNLKENIKYLKYDGVNPLATTSDEITTKDLLEFITNDYLLATYNYIGQDDTKLSAVAQDVIYKPDSSINKVGELIVDCEEVVDNNTMLTMNQTQLLNVVIGALQELNNKVNELEVSINGSK